MREVISLNGTSALLLRLDRYILAPFNPESVADFSSLQWAKLAVKLQIHAGR